MVKKRKSIAIVAIASVLALLFGGIAYADYYLPDGTHVTYVDPTHVQVNGQTVSASLNSEGRLVPTSGLTATQQSYTNQLPSQSMGQGNSDANGGYEQSVPIFTNGSFSGYGNRYTNSSDGLGYTYVAGNGGVTNSDPNGGSSSWIQDNNGYSGATSITDCGWCVNVTTTQPTSSGSGGGSYTPPSGGGGSSYTPPSYTPPVYHPPVYTPPPPQPPNTPSFTVTPNPAKDTDTLTFSKTETDPQGRGIIAERWTVDGGATQSTPPNSLAAGAHTITLQDENSAGLWSGTDSQQINILPAVQAAIGGAQLTDVVHPLQMPLNLPMNLPLSAPVSVHSGYNVTMHVASQGAGTIKMDLYSNGQSIPIGQGDSVVNELSTSVPDGGGDITFFIPTSVANGSIIDVKFTLNCTDPKGYATSAVFSTPRTFEVSGSMYDDVLQNQTH